MEYKLTKSQQVAFDLIEYTQDNYILLGKPGVGKSVLINAITTLGNKTFTLGAPTGLAALNIYGRTLHSIFKIPVSEGIIHPTYDRYPTPQDRAYGFIKYQLQRLIVDEISMVRCDVMDYIDRCLRHVKGYDKPFGGIQIIVIGDFYQLPPVVKGVKDKQALKLAGYRSEFMFSAQCYTTGNFKPIVLNEVLRQKGDPDFVKLLDGARDGSVLPKELTKLNKQVGRPSDIRINLTGTNKQADEVNQIELSKIQAPSVTFIADIWGEWPAGTIEERITLKVGAQVMCKSNGADRPEGLRGEFDSIVVNGTLGKIIAIEDGKPRKDLDGLEVSKDEIPAQSVTIELNDGRQAKIYRKRKERKVKEQEADGKWVETVIASYEQMPLTLAWAISIHKSQGQSFDLVHIDARKIFAAGQLYVALSRARSMAGISLEVPLTSSQFYANRDVIDYFNEIEETV